MSQSASPSTNKPGGVAAVTRVWQVPRSTFYAVKARQSPQARPPAKRGPKTDHSDAALAELIRQQIAASPFHGEGHREIWARLRLADIWTAKPRVLRLMREAQLLAPTRRPHAAEHEHNGQITTKRPNQMGGTDGTTTITRKDGTATIFAAIDYYTPDCARIDVAKRGTRFEAIEPLRQGVREYFGGFGRHVAAGLIPRHEHGIQYMSDDFQKEVDLPGMTSSPSFVQQPEGSGCIERFFRTLKESKLWDRHSESIEELRQALLEFKETYNRRWLIGRIGYKSPWPTRQECLAEKIAA